jgi:hypothetical protein
MSQPKSVSRTNRIKAGIFGGILFLFALLAYFRFPEHLRAIQIAAGIVGAIGSCCMAFVKYRNERWFLKAVMLSFAIQPALVLIVWRQLPFSNGIVAAVVGGFDAIACAYVFIKLGPPGMTPGR